MPIKLYNTLTREKEELKPIHPEWVGLYTCGPTVYNFQHIGNYRAYVFDDILQKTLEYNGHDVRRVMNITDVGHLTGDSDAGEDKLDKVAQAEEKSVEKIAQFYTDAFFADLEKLNIKKPDIVAPATKFINEQLAVIQTLFENGFAYDTPNAVYFDVSKSKDYGKLSGQSLDEKMIGARDEVVVDAEKRNAADFVLWFKLEGKFKNHLLHWPSPWGEGFPGWHIECSAISRHFLGQPFDIHTGGVDHIGTHHTNEIAQSEGAFGVPLAHIWMHNEHVLIDGAKMAKSEPDKFITLKDLEEKGYHPVVLRYLFLSAHYRTRLNFTWESLGGAVTALGRIYYAYHESLAQSKVAAQGTDMTDVPLGKAASALLADFNKSIADDVNTPQALDILHKTIRSADISAPEKVKLLEKFDVVLDILVDPSVHQDVTHLPKEVEELKSQYQQFRSSKQFVQSDALRKEIEALGYEVRDTENGPYVVKKFF